MNDETPADDIPEDDEIDMGELRAETLMVDIRDAMLGQIRDLRTPWPLMPEDRQREVAAAMELAAKNLVRRTVRLLSNFSFPYAVISLGEVKIKGEKGIEAKITCQNIEHNRTVLGEHVGQFATLYMVDSEAFMAERDAIISPDQTNLFGDEAA